MVREGYYIDDSGTPGVRSKSAFLSESRKYWCAVVVPRRASHPVSVAMGILLFGVRQDYGAEELHFADIYSGRGVWRGVAVEDRIKIFDLMTDVFVKFGLPVIFQTVSESMFSDHAERFSRVVSEQGQFWKIKSIPHFGLLLTCWQVARQFRYLKSEYPSDFTAPLPAFVDEGLAKAGCEVGLPNWEDAIEGKRLTFDRSVDNPGLQLADFGAFTIAKSQWLSAKQEKGTPVSSSDLHIMKISGRLNLFNLDKVVIDPNTYSREDYEDFLMRDRVRKGLPKRP